MQVMSCDMPPDGFIQVMNRHSLLLRVHVSSANTGQIFLSLPEGMGQHDFYFTVPRGCNCLHPECNLERKDVLTRCMCSLLPLWDLELARSQQISLRSRGNAKYTPKFLCTEGPETPDLTWAMSSCGQLAFSVARVSRQHLLGKGLLLEEGHM